MQNPVEKTLIFSSEIWHWTTHIGSSFYMLHHHTTSCSMMYIIALQHHVESSYLTTTPARNSCSNDVSSWWKSECVSQTLCITNKFTHEKKILLHLPTCLSMRSFFSTSISLLGSCDHTLSWTCKRFEAKCKYQTTEHSKLEHLKQNANTKQRNIPSLNIWSKMQIPNNGTFQA